MNNQLIIKPNSNCYFCNNKLPKGEYYGQVRQALKPKGKPFRWLNLGLICDDCRDSGEIYEFENLQ